jgi:hypothetical protein
MTMKPLTAEEIVELHEFAAEMRGPTSRSEENTLGGLLARLLDEVERSRAVLKRIEWSASDNTGASLCPECDEDRGWGDSGGHAPGCELAALLGA